MAHFNVGIVDVAEVKLERQFLTGIMHLESSYYSLKAARVGGLTGILLRLQTVL